MDAIATKKLSMWKAMQTLIESEKTVDIIMSNISLILEDTHTHTVAHEELALAALTLVKGAAGFTHCKLKLISAGALKHMTMAAETGTPAMQKMARDIIMTLTDTVPASSAGAAAPSGVSSSATSKRELRGVQLNMDGLLGRRAEEDMYIKALLMVDGVTSVTIDRKREVALVYTYEEREMKEKLYDVVQTVCDQIQDDAGLPRKSVKASDHAAYLEEDDDMEDFFAAGGKGVLTKTMTGAKKEKTAEDRFKERGQAAPPAGGYFTSFTSWLGF